MQEGDPPPPVGPRQRRGLQEEWIQLFPFSFLLVSLSFQILFGFKEDGDVLLLFFWLDADVVLIIHVSAF